MTAAEIERVLENTPGFYRNYVQEAGNGDVVADFRAQIQTAHEVFGKEFRDRLDHRYAPGKWSVIEILGHLIDAERVFMYRAMRFSRNDQTPLPGYEEDEFIAATDFGARGVDNLLEEFEGLRRATIALYVGLTEEEKWRVGNANGTRISVYALFLATLGHFNHHLGVVGERYV